MTVTSNPDLTPNPTSTRVRLAKAPFAQTVLVCGKCARRAPDHGGKGVRSALKKALKTRRWGKVRVVETKCLDLCPKRRLVLASGRTLADRRLVVVEPGFDVDAALGQLLGPPLLDPLSREPSSAPELDAVATPSAISELGG